MDFFETPFVNFIDRLKEQAGVNFYFIQCSYLESIPNFFRRLIGIVNCGGVGLTTKYPKKKKT